MNTIVFDLKGTLVDENGQWNTGAKEALSDAQASAKTILYTMNEPWTYQQLAKYSSELQQFNMVMMVARKQESDLASMRGSRVLVVGDSDVEELRFGRTLGYEVWNARGGIDVDVVRGFLEVKR